MVTVRYVLVVPVVAIILLGIVSGYYLIKSQNGYTYTETSNRFITITLTQTEIQLSYITHYATTPNNNSGGNNNQQPQRIETISKEVLVNYVAHYTVYVYANCTVGAGTIGGLDPTSTTSYVFPQDMSGYLNVTIVSNATTVQSIESTITTTVHSSLPPETITYVNGTSTSYSTLVCPVYS